MMLHLKINALIKSCITKINNISLDNAKDFNKVMPMYNQLEYSSNYSMTSGSLWTHCKK